MAIQPAAEFVSTRRIGDATVSIICDGVFGTVPLRQWLQVPEEDARKAMPEADENGVLSFDINAAHISIGNASILIDPGWGDLDSDTYPTTWYLNDLGARPTLGIAAGLAAIGVRPEEITHVIITHTDEDHFLGVTVQRDGRQELRYPRARHLLMRYGWDENPERAKPDSETALRLGAVERPGLLDLVEDDHEIVPGVTMIHMPGENASHCIVRMRSDGESFYYLGDLFHHALEIEHPDWFFEWHDREAISASRQRFFAEDGLERATLTYTHRRFPGWGRVVRTNAGYTWQDT